MRARSAAAAMWAAGLLAAGCAPHGAPVSTTSSPAASPTAAAAATPVPVHVHGFGTKQNPSVLTGRKQGRRIYVIRALAFEGDIAGSADGSAVLQEPHITFVDRSGANTIADAPKATVKQRDNTVFMTGGVHARTAEGAVLTCDTLRYDARGERFHGEGHIVVTGPNGTQLTGDHLDGDVRLHDARVTSGGRS
ncbi:MAG TPA: LPS export ABC transporter periplasmic protein LptC [Candidatus Elarobacter sp.]|nr:LPS export ABC transporter periplasmic protein LptC [Candidatus Elarobacter sp.]